MIALDITGERYDKLVAVRRTDVKKGKVFAWLFRCDCGEEVIRTVGDVRSSFKRGRMCACYYCVKKAQSAVPNRTSHGMRYTRFYDCWRDMKKRCSNPKSKSYPAYGGRGITVCERWIKFENFYDDMFDTYWDGATIERLDVNGNYEPNNCCWIPRNEQWRNMRKSYKDINVKELSEKSGIHISVLYNRLTSGWPVDKLLLPPSSSNTQIGLKGTQTYERVGTL